MILPETYNTILDQHSFKQAIAIPECAVIYRYDRICCVDDLSVEVDVVQDGNYKLYSRN